MTLLLSWQLVYSHGMAKGLLDSSQISAEKDSDHQSKDQETGLYSK